MTSKGPSPASSPKASHGSPDSPELEQSREWCASASQHAKTQPDLAYKMFARAGQTFAKHFRTREAAQCYFSVVQLQQGILRTKISDQSLKFLNTLPSFLEIAISDSSINEESQQILTSLSVLFKSYLYLARLFRPHEPSLSLRMFWNCLECIIPSQIWTIMEKILWNEPISNMPSTSLISTDPVSSSAFERLSNYSLKIATSLQPGLSFVDNQRTKAGQTLTLTSELAIICRELAGFLCTREPSVLGICLYQLSMNFSFLNVHDTSISEAQNIDLEKKDLSRQSTLLGALKLSHWQFDTLYQLAKISDPDERYSIWQKAVIIALNLGTFLLFMVLCW